MKNKYKGKSILFLTDVPYVITGRSASVFERDAVNIFVNNFNIIYSEK